MTWMWVSIIVVLVRSKAERGDSLDTLLPLVETAALADELLTAIRIPLASASRRWGFEEVSQRQGDFALFAVAVTFVVDAGR